MSYAKSGVVAAALIAEIGQLNSIAGTIQVKINGTPATVADNDAEYAGILSGYISQIQKLYDELNRLSNNLITG